MSGIVVVNAETVVSSDGVTDVSRLRHVDASHYAEAHFGRLRGDYAWKRKQENERARGLQGLTR